MRRSWERFHIYFEAPDAGAGGGDAGGSHADAGGAAADADGAAAVVHDPIPFDVHDTLRKEHEGLSWAKGLDRETVEKSTRLWNWLDEDPRGAYDYVTNLMRRSGILKPPATDDGRAAAVTRDYPHDPQSGEPLADIKIAETGQLLYSAEQTRRWGQWLKGDLEKQIKPARDFVKTYEDRESASRAGDAFVNEAWTSWPHFQTYAEDILKEFKAGDLTLEAAYRKIVIPKVEEETRKAFAADLRRRGAAGKGNPNPAGAAPGSTVDTRKQPIRQLLETEFRRRGIIK